MSKNYKDQSASNNRKKTGKNTPSEREGRAFPKKQRENVPAAKRGKFDKKASVRPPATPEYDLKKINAAKGTAEQTTAKPGEEHLIRLNKYIANSGICSRREADNLIEKGDITVNGQVITALGYKVNRGDSVKYKNKVLKREKMVYVLLNKPKDFITTTHDPEDRKTVMNLVASACEERIYPVGRLDRNTTGLILLTNDGDLTKKLSHPSYMVKKLYQVDLDKPVSDEDFLKIQAGITLEDGVAEVDELAFVTPDNTSLGIEIHIGRNRIVRRIFESLGYQVLKLDRVMYAGLTKLDLPRGRWRYLTEKEVIRLKYMK